jgi:hypothetical protein
MSEPFILEKDGYRLVVGVHPERAYLSVGHSGGGTAIMLSPAELLSTASRLIEAASAIIDRQFQQRLGSP